MQSPGFYQDDSVCISESTQNKSKEKKKQVIITGLVK